MPNLLILIFILEFCIGTTVFRQYFKGVMVFNATFNNISAISWRSAFFVEEPGVQEESQRPYFKDIVEVCFYWLGDLISRHFLSTRFVLVFQSVCCIIFFNCGRHSDWIFFEYK